MRISLKWMKTLLDIDMSIDELKDRLDLTGTAVETVITIGEALDGVVVGQIVAKESHPDADKLWVTTVDVGSDALLTIVCGAQNFETGDKVPVATVGSTLPNGMEIKKAKLRGVVSMGMNCSAAELGMGSDQSGLLILPPDAPVGVPFAEYKDLTDTVLELEITPNRPDCLSVVGMAREMAAVLGTTFEIPSGFPDETGEPIADSLRVDILDPELCSRYTARLIRNVKIGPSPDWLVERIVALGQRPVNNVVDITNYVMFELGQPLHAFDAATLGRDSEGVSHIIVRRAGAGERLTTLDGQDRPLDPGMLIIADPNGPVGLAGVMGGENTEVSEETVDIILEAASFDQVVTSHTSRSLALISEASMRFERGVDPMGCIAAQNRAAQLMAEYCGGLVAPGLVDVCPEPIQDRSLELRRSRVNRMLGTQLPAQDIETVLRALGLGVEVHDGDDSFSVDIPSFRPDLTREIDLIEEVLRVWGMDRVPSTLPGGRERIGGLDSGQRWRERIAATMRAAGLNETITYAFVDPGDLGRLSWELDDGELLVELLNPMSEEQAVLRRTLAPGLLRAVSYNQRRGVENVHLYELGRVFSTSEGRKLPRERDVVAGLLAGRWHAPTWHDPRSKDKGVDAALRGPQLNFFDGKGIVEILLEDLGISRWSTRSADVPWLQPGRAAEIVVRGQSVGWLGEVHPRVLEQFEAQAPVVMFELQLAALIKAAVAIRPSTDVPRFPAISFDVALVVDEAVTAESVEQSLSKAGGKLLESVRLFDVYRGAGIPEGKKSLAFALSYRAEDRTLTDEEVRPAHDRAIRKVSASLGAELRS